MDQYVISFFTAPAYTFDDGSFLSWGWIILTVLVWSLIPGSIILKMVMAARTRRVFKETQPAIDAGILRIKSTIATKMMEKHARSSYTMKPDFVEAYETFTCKECGRPTNVRRVRFKTVYCFHCNAVLLSEPFNGDQTWRTPAAGVSQPKPMTAVESQKNLAAMEERTIRSRIERDREDEERRRNDQSFLMQPSMVPPTVYDPPPSYSAPSYDQGPTSMPDCSSPDPGPSFDSGSCSDTSSSF